MISRTGNSRIRRATTDLEGSRAFTLIELILVMALLLIVLSLSAPALSGFFRGRTLDSEANRFLSLTRYGQSRAISEGVPMLLWVDKESREYGLREEGSYSAAGSRSSDAKESVFQLAPDLEMELEFVGGVSGASGLSGGLGTVGSGTGTGRAMEFQSAGTTLPSIRFLPDGFIAETSPDLIWIRRGEKDNLAITRSRNRLNYEIQTNKLEIGARQLR